MREAVDITSSFLEGVHLEGVSSQGKLIDEKKSSNKCQKTR